MLKHLANILTGLRLVLAPVVALALWSALQPQPDADMWAMLAGGLFIAAALTDLFDGMAARAFDGESKLGRVLDPIADKALVGLPLLVLAIVAWRWDWQLWQLIAIPTAVIIARDALITILRLASPDGEGARVSMLAKWKTTLELLAVGAPILAIAAGPFMRTSGIAEGFAISGWAGMAWIATLNIAAALSAVTALQYLTAPKAA